MRTVQITRGGIPVAPTRPASPAVSAPGWNEEQTGPIVEVPGLPSWYNGPWRLDLVRGVRPGPSQDFAGFGASPPTKASYRGAYPPALIPPPGFSDPSLPLWQARDLCAAQLMYVENVLKQPGLGPWVPTLLGNARFWLISALEEMRRAEAQYGGWEKLQDMPEVQKALDGFRRELPRAKAEWDAAQGRGTPGAASTGAAIDAVSHLYAELGEIDWTSEVVAAQERSAKLRPWAKLAGAVGLFLVLKAIL